MAQVSNIVLSPNISGTDQRTEINDIIADFVTGHSGASRPAYLTASLEGMWVKEVSGTVREIYYWDKTDDILMGTVDLSANTYTASGSSVQFGKLTSNKTGAFTAVNGDCGTVFTCNATSASFSAAIDPTAGLQTGWFAIFQKTDSSANTVTIDPNSTDTINGATTLQLTRQYDAVIVIKVGATSFVGLLQPNAALLAPLASPALTGTPTAPTAAPGTNTTQIATTAYATAADAVVTAAVATTYAPKASPALTGTPTAPTASGGTNTTQIATTAFVTAALAAVSGVVKTVKEQVITASGTYTPSTGMLYCLVFCTGGGGGGGGATGSGSSPGGQGGGAGGTAIKIFSAATIGASQSVTIGGGGGPQTGGGNTTFGALLTGSGGGGGAASAGLTGGVGGGASNGTINIPGGDGGDQSILNSSGMGGLGGASFWGGGGKGLATAQAYGAGGGGARAWNTTAGSGKAGVVYIVEFCSQ